MNQLAPSPAPDPDLRHRVWLEYVEMPGLQLTVRQACRLWTTDVATGERVLNELVARAFLRQRGEFYVRADSDRAGF